MKIKGYEDFIKEDPSLGKKITFEEFEKSIQINNNNNNNDELENFILSFILQLDEYKNL